MSQEEAEEYKIEADIGERVKKCTTQFLINLKGYPYEENATELEENANCQELIDKFRASVRNVDIENLNKTSKFFSFFFILLFGFVFLTVSWMF